MNCKPGDLAVVVHSYADNEGRIVTCIKPAGNITWSFGGSAPSWFIEPPLVSVRGTIESLIADWQLRPIRDNDGQDESLTWAGKPQQINSPELVK